MMKKTGIFLFFMLASSAIVAGAEDKFGVPVYPGAKFDEVTTKNSLQMGFFKQAACYRTNDSVAAAAGYYKKQGLASKEGVKKERAPMPGLPDTETADFTKGKIQVHILSPWISASPQGGTGTLMKDTSVCLYGL